MNETPLLSVTGLGVEFATAGGWLPVTHDVGFALGAGETVGLVGESGCGKTVSALALTGLLPPRAARVRGSVEFEGRELLTLTERELRAVRSNEISMIFQEPMTSLNPAYTVGNQIAEVARAHRGGSRKAAWARAVEMLDRVGIANAARRARDYPHAFSGGMRQRAMIAMALVNEPKLLIADEPTTALDVTIQAQILELLSELQTDFGMAVLFVTHDLGVVAEICDEVVVMYAGEVVERATITELFARPAHPYTQALLESMPQSAPRGGTLHAIPGQVPRPDALPRGCRFQPRCRHQIAACAAAPVSLEVRPSETWVRCIRAAELEAELHGQVPTVVPAVGETVDPGEAGTEVEAAAAEALVEVHGLYKEFPVHSGILRRVTGQVRAIDGVDFSIRAGETLGLVGESGSGKSTVARLLTRLVEPSAGEIRFRERDLVGLDRRELRRVRRDLQIVFQDPYSSLDPRATVGASIGEPLGVFEGLRGRDRAARVGELLAQVGLDASHAKRFPHEFSGGQRQRIAIARALAVRPALLVCDEPLSSLDVSTQSQVINLLMELQRELSLTYLFISHDLAVVRHISDRIAVMYLGRIVELGAAEEVYRHPAHPYTEALLSAIPVPDPTARESRSRIVLAGDVPSPLAPPSGCRFHPRCPAAMDVCREVDPAPTVTAAGTTVACHLHTGVDVPAPVARPVVNVPAPD